MLYELLRKATRRHFKETRILLEQLTDQCVLAEPVETGRTLGEIYLHMIRSLEYYLQGIAADVWEALPYDLGTYGTANAIRSLYEEVVKKGEDYMRRISPKEMDELLDREEFNRPGTRGEVWLEMIEHSVQHRGQVLVYYRLLGIEAPKIDYIL